MKKFMLFSRFVLPVLLIVGFLFTNTEKAFATTSGPNNAGTGSNVAGVGSVDWSNPDRITADDGQNATAIMSPFTDSKYLQGTNYGFSIPSGATIDGIQVSISRKSSATTLGFSINDNVVKLVKGGSVVGNNQASSTDWTTTTTTASYGSANDLWGTGWTPADINSSNFGVVLSASTQSLLTNRTASVNYIQVTVYYTKENPTISVSNSPVTYTGLAQSATISGSVPGVASDVKYNGSSTVPTNVGTYAVTADFMPTDTVNYNNLSDAPAGNLEITKANANINVSGFNGPYDGDSHGLTGTATGVLDEALAGLVLEPTSYTNVTSQTV